MMSGRILKWLTTMEAMEGVGQKMLQVVTMMSMSLGLRPVLYSRSWWVGVWNCGGEWG